MTGSGAKVEAKSAEVGAPASETADAAATGPSVRSPFRLVVHFAGPDQIRGGHSRDFLHGTPSETDHFDADAGGDDILFGMTGDDVYWLGRGTGRDTIMDSGGTGDVIRLKEGLTADDVRLVVDGSRRIHVALVDASGEETDRYTIAAPFFGIERVELSSGETVFDSGDFHHAWADFVRQVVESGHEVTSRLGGAEFAWDWGGGAAIWTGSQSADSFLTGSPSSDEYRGRGGNDIYWLGTDSGHDRVNEHEGNPSGDPGDAIVVMSGISAPRRGLGADLESAVPVGGGPAAWVRWSEDGRDLVIDVVEREPDGRLTTHSSLTVDEFFFRGNAQVEQIVFADNPWATLSLRELRTDRIRGVAGRDFLHGTPGTDHFDADGGGDDTLFGMSGDDIYWLGPGTGRDTILDSGGTGDVIRLKDGLAADDVRLVGGGHRMHVVLVDAEGAETDRYTIADPIFGVERVELSNGETVFDGTDFVNAWRDHTGQILLPLGSAPDVASYYGEGEFAWERATRGSIWTGSQATDSFLVGNSAPDVYRGRGGNDIYWLGVHSGHDRVNEHEGNPTGDSGDAIVVMSGISAPRRGLGADLESAVPVGGGPAAWVRWSEDGRDLVIDVVEREPDGRLTTHSSLTVDEFFFRGNAQVEQIVFADAPWATLSLGDLRPGRIRGGAGRDFLHGTPGTDHFDADGGGDDTLFGMSGDDIYWLGPGTGRDTIVSSGGTGDVIRLKSGLVAGDVRLTWDARGSHVALVDADGAETDRYTVARGLGVRRVELSDGGTVFGKDDFTGAFIRYLQRDFPQSEEDLLRRLSEGEDEAARRRDLETGGLDLEKVRTPGAERRVWTGSQADDSFLAGVGSERIPDVYQGRGGNDIYWLDTSSGHDRVREHEGNPTGDPGDAIVVRGGISAPRQGTGTDLGSAVPAGGGPTAWVRRSTDGRDLVVDVVEMLSGGTLMTHSSLTVEEFFVRGSARVEQVVFAGDPSASLSLEDLLGAPRMPIVGGPGDDTLRGGAHSDVFDAIGGGDDRLHGHQGDDTYRLGLRTGSDTVFEVPGAFAGNDRVVVKGGIHIPGPDRMWRIAGGEQPTLRVRRGNNGRDLVLEVTAKGEVVSALTVRDHYVNFPGDTRVEGFYDAHGREVLSFDDLMAARIAGGPGDDSLYGEEGGQHFDISAGGNDSLSGSGGSDVYWLGSGGNGGTGTIREWWGRDKDVDTSDEFDVIRLSEDISVVGEDGLWRTLKTWRSHDGDDLHVALLVGGEAASTYIVEDQYRAEVADAKIEAVLSVDGDVILGADDLAKAPFVGGEGNDWMVGTGGDDHFDISAGGNDFLHGEHGDDVYWLGSDGNGGTGTIREWSHRDRNVDTAGEFDVIRLGEDISAVGEDGLWRTLKTWRSPDGNDLHVALLVDGEVASSYIVDEHYRGGRDARIEAVLSVDGQVVLDADDLADAPFAGGEGDDRIVGTSGDDHFDGSLGGSDLFLGREGDDVYWLDRGTGDDRLREGRHWDTGPGDPGDAIRIVSPHVGRSDVSVAREGDHLVVGLLGAGGGAQGDSIKVLRHFSRESARVEKIELNGATLLVRDLTSAIDAIAEFNARGWSTTLDLVPDRLWQDPSDSLAGPAA